MSVQVISMAFEGSAGVGAAREELCEVCAASCAALPGLQAQLWWSNPETGVCTGVLRWGDDRIAARQAEQASALVSAVCRPSRLRIRSRVLDTADRPRAAEGGPVGSVRYPEDYDCRG